MQFSSNLQRAPPPSKPSVGFMGPTMKQTALIAKTDGGAELGGLADGPTGDESIDKRAAIFILEVYERFRESYKGKEEIHTRLMRKYRDIPEWWFYMLLVLTVGISHIMCTALKDQVQLPWWGLLFACAVAFVFTLPISIITAITNQMALRETINRILESTTSSAENARSVVHVQDMESARCSLPKAPSPTLSATAKEETMTNHREDHTHNIKETFSIHWKFLLLTCNGEPIKILLVKTMQCLLALRPTTQIGLACNGEWMDIWHLLLVLCPYMGYTPGPFEVPFRGVLPQDPFGGQGYMMPVVPPQRAAAGKYYREHCLVAAGKNNIYCFRELIMCMPAYACLFGSLPVILTPDKDDGAACKAEPDLYDDEEDFSSVF